MWDRPFAAAARRFAAAGLRGALLLAAQSIDRVVRFVSLTSTPAIVWETQPYEERRGGVRVCRVRLGAPDRDAVRCRVVT